MGIDYASEKLTMAVYTLAVGIGDVRERLFYAAIEFTKPDESLFPDDLKELRAEIYYELTSEDPIDEEGRIRSTLDKLTLDECQAIAEKIYNLSYSVRQAWEVRG